MKAIFQSSFWKNILIVMQSCNALPAGSGWRDTSNKHISPAKLKNPLGFYTCMSLETLSAQELFEQGKEFLNDKMYDLALKNFLTAQKKDPNIKMLYTLIGNCYLYKRDAGRAVNAYKKSIDLEDEKHAHHNLGLLYFQLKMYGKSSKELAIAEKKGFQTGEVYYHLARALVLDKQFDAAQKTLAKAHKVTGKDQFLEMKKKLQDRKKELNRKFPGVRELEENITQHPEVLKNYNDLVSHYLRVNDHEKAVDVLERCLKANKQNLNVYQNFASYLFEKGRFKEASEVLEKGVKIKVEKLNNTYINMYVNLAQAYLKIEENKKAKRTLQRLLDLNPPRKTLIKKMLKGITS